MSPSLIAIDWGTTGFRAYLLGSSGVVMEAQSSSRGILAIEQGAFEATLIHAVAPWRTRYGPMPIVMSGMIGSRQGWREAPYVQCPVDTAALAAQLVTISTSLGPVAIVPGIVCRPDGHAPDVMRGEEAQVIGALDRLQRHAGLLVLPGTHAKWVRAEAGCIQSFSTFMTGEVFAALKDHTILGRQMRGPGGGDVGFAAGVDASRNIDGGPGDLLNRLFSVRTLGLFGELAPENTADYLSGLLIGAEMQAALRAGGEEIVIIGSEALSARYAMAAKRLGVGVVVAPNDCAATGIHRIAAAARIGPAG